MEDFKHIVDEMRGKGIETALVKRDGGLVYSTFGMDDPAPFISQYLANNSQLLMEQLGDKAKEIEISFKDKVLLLIPVGNYVLLGLLKGKEDRETLRGYVQSIRSML